MTRLTIPDLDEPVLRRLQARAAANGLSLEDEVLEILRAATATTAAPRNLADAIQRRVEPFGGIELEPLPREPMREPPFWHGGALERREAALEEGAESFESWEEARRRIEQDLD